MANKFHIYFFGLICHIGRNDDAKDYAAIVRDDDHEPRMYYYDGSIKFVEIDRKSDEVKFQFDKPVAAGGADTTYDFLRFVPSLKQLMGGRLRDDIEKAIIKIHYPVSKPGGGELTIPKLYEPNQGVYYRSGIRRWGPDCVAKATELTIVADATYMQVVRYESGTPYNVGDPIKAGECVAITNFPLEHGAGHATKYGNILSYDTSQILVAQPYKCDTKLDNEAKCPWVREWLKRGGIAPDDLECGNTNWP